VINRKDNREKRLYLNFEGINKKIKERFNTILSQNGANITFDQWLILSEIAEKQGANQKEIATSLAKEVSSVSRILKKLSSKNLVIKKINAQNIREYKLYLSPEGYEIVNGLGKTFVKTFKSIFSSVYEQELNLVNDIISRVNKDLAT